MFILFKAYGKTLIGEVTQRDVLTNVDRNHRAYMFRFSNDQYTLVVYMYLYFFCKGIKTKPHF